jgi:DNA invertase Pin-like site-specific DNA recombinase
MTQPKSAHDARIDAAYMRCSTVEQGTKYGLERQREAIVQNARRAGREIQKWYIDLESGTKENRKDFKQLQRDAAAGLIRNLDVLCVDRFARNTEHALRGAGHIMAGGANLNFVELPADLRTPMGMFQFTQLASFAALEVAFIKERTGQGRERKMADGKRPDCWILPYGYHVVNDTPYLDEAKAEWIRKMYRWRREGKSAYEIVDLLRKGKAPTARRAKKGWQHTSVLNILRHRSYIGEYERCGNLYSCPPIIERQLWQEVQDLMRVTYHATVGRPSRDYLLSGWTFCRCGAKRVGAISNGYRYYRCNNIHREPPAHCTCPYPNPNVRADLLEDAVFEGIWALLTDPRRLRALAEADAREAAKEKPNERNPVRELERAHGEEKRVQDMTRAGIYDIPTGKAELAAVRKMITALVIEVQALRKVIAIAPLNAIERACAQYNPDPKAKPRSYEARRLVLEGLLDFRVTVRSGEDAVVTGCVPMPAAENAQNSTGSGQMNCTNRLTSVNNTHESIPFVLNVRVAA